MTALTAQLREGHGLSVVELRGNVDRDAEPALLAAWEDIRTRPAGSVVLDFSAVDYINSTGIAVIVQLLARARAEGRRLAVYGLTDHYRHVFEITRLIDFMDVYRDEDAARAATPAAS